MWQETYAKHAKTFVRVWRSEGDRSWAEPVGLRLEFVLEVDPTALKNGDEIVVRLLRNGYSPKANARSKSSGQVSIRAQREEANIRAP